jgi:hypothetical protein
VVYLCLAASITPLQVDFNVTSTNFTCISKPATCNPATDFYWTIDRTRKHKLLWMENTIDVADQQKLIVLIAGVSLTAVPAMVFRDFFYDSWRGLRDTFQADLLRLADVVAFHDFLYNDSILKSFFGRGHNHFQSEFMEPHVFHGNGGEMTVVSDCPGLEQQQELKLSQSHDAGWWYLVYLVFFAGASFATCLPPFQLFFKDSGMQTKYGRRGQKIHWGAQDPNNPQTVNIASHAYGTRSLAGLAQPRGNETQCGIPEEQMDRCSRILAKSDTLRRIWQRGVFGEILGIFFESLFLFVRITLYYNFQLTSVSAFAFKNFYSIYKHVQKVISIMFPTSCCADPSVMKKLDEGYDFLNLQKDT